MITRQEDQKVFTKNQMQGGNGSVQIRQFLQEEDAAGAGRMFGILTFQPGVSIGVHQHRGEFEIIYVMEGTARVTDNGKEFIVHAGDSTLCRDGDSHGIENIGDGPLVITALILNTR